MRRRIVCLLSCAAAWGADADLILHNAKVITVDARFSVKQAVAIKAGRIVAVGGDGEVLGKEKGPRTKIIDLRGKAVLPGLIDAHVHALDSGLSEFRAPLPPLNSIADIQNYVRMKAKSTPKGAWIVVPRTLPPRLKEMRMPVKQDLDVTPDHPVAFDGSYVWAANTMALKMSGITRDTPNPPGGEVVKGADGEPNGILRNASQLLKDVTKAEPFTEAERLAALEKMLRLYAEAGLTAVGDRAVTPEEVELFRKLKAQGRLPLRVVLTWRINAARPVEEVVREIQASSWTTNQGDEWLKFGAFKVTLDGGQSVGTAYQRMPYGAFGRQLYGQTNPDARGTLFVEPQKLTQIFAAARDKGWQLTAHAQGGGAIDVLLDSFEALDRVKPIAPTRSHVMHGSFQSVDSLDRMKRLGILADVQPGWLHYDEPALERVFGLRNMEQFYPLRGYLDRGIVVAGGSDHMLGYDSNNAVNPFNPFFGMWMSITRRTTEGKVIYDAQKITREEAIRMHTTGPAYMHFSEKEAGSIEVGKLADLVVIDRDILTCPEDDVRAIRPVMTVLDGKITQRTLPAFPGAEGFGAQTPGGRGGRVLVVRNLNDAGPGSLREALQAKGPRTVVFGVSGIIDLKSQIRVSEPFLTVAGQSAPGEGICLRGDGISVSTHDVVIRYLRVRPGEGLGKEVDAIAIGGESYNVVIDHCSASWSVDEALSPSGGIRDVTVQWCLIGESLRKSVHKKGEHGYGSLARAVGGVTFHHNLWVKNTARNPRLGDNYGKPPFPIFDVRNNVMALWGGTCSGMTGDELSANYVDNYLKPGPESSDRPPIALTKTARVRYHVAGNVVEGRPQHSGNDGEMFAPAEEGGRKLFELMPRPFGAPAVSTTKAGQAYEHVLAGAGAGRPVRDAVDARIIEEVRSGKGRIIDSTREVGGWPVYKAVAAAPDRDGDGMPDSWESARGMNPQDAGDAALDRDGDGYTNVEEYLNWLARPDAR
jgi:predicted amidohydrolase YtcJ